MTPPPDSDKQPRARRTGRPVPGEQWPDRCSRLFEEMRRPARAMVSRAYGRALTGDEIEDVYSAAWAATLSALRERGRRMGEQELRAYILTAVASHASKEMRRRSRKPVQSLESDRARAVTDGHAPLPEEIAIGSESRGVARDLLSSLPARRRAVMLLRYGWGLSPQEVCALVPGLSPRAYRKEITRGVEDLIAGLGKIEGGEWCSTREPMLRDLIAGTADESTRRQALEHIRHCRACSDLASRLSRELHDVGSAVALATVAGCIGGSGLPVLQSLAELIRGIRTGLASAVEKVEVNAGTLLTSGGAKGSGTVGAGAVAKLAGVGGGAKAALACLGAGAAATACVAAGVVPGVSFDSDPPDQRRGAPVQLKGELDPLSLRPRPAVTSVLAVSEAVESDGLPGPHQPEPDHSASGPDPAPSDPVAPEPAPAPAPVEEFDPVAAATAAAPAPVEAPQQDVAGPSGSAAQNEFGP